MILEERDGGVSFSIIVTTRASRSAINGMIGDYVKVRVNSPPVDNKANSECIALLSKVFNIAKSKIEITHGLTSRRKKVFIAETSVERTRQILEEHII